MGYSACDFMDQITNTLTSAGVLPVDAFASEDSGSMEETGDACSMAILKLVADRSVLLDALQKIVKDAPDKKPDEETYDDMESAYGNGLEVSAWDAAVIAARAIRVAIGPERIDAIIAAESVPA